MHHKTCFGGKYIPRVSFNFKGQPPSFIPQKMLFGEHLQHKPMESVFAYILTTDKAIITKLHKNIKQVKYYIKCTITGQKGCGLGHGTYFQILRPLYISGTAEARNMKFGVQIDYDECYSNWL